MDSMSTPDIPNPAGRMALVTVSHDPIDPASLLQRVGDSSAGAAVLFLGTVRDHSAGRKDVSRLEYEAYGGVVEEKIAAIVAAACERWPVLQAAVAHRLGTLDVGEVTVAVAVSSAHRSDAFEAGRFLIDEVKRSAPIWKKEHWPGGAEWVREGDHDAT